MNVPATSSGLLTAASTTLVTGPGRLRGLTVGADGTNAATVIIYDNTAASGTVLYKLVAKATDRAAIANIPDDGICANTGITVSIAGTGAECVVLYDKS